MQQLGELVIATGADALSPDELAGALIVLAETKDAGKKEAWAKRGAAFFQRRAWRIAKASDRDTEGAAPQPGGAQPASGGDMRTWQVERRKRTRHLIELGGLAGVVEMSERFGQALDPAPINVADVGMDVGQISGGLR